ncbi:MAG: hypothetical protein ACLRNQ_17315 [Flavonifractor plautii]
MDKSDYKSLSVPLGRLRKRPFSLSEHPGGESNPGRGYAVDPGLYRGHILRQQKQRLHSGAMKGEHYDDSGVGFLWDSCSLYSFV